MSFIDFDGLQDIAKINYAEFHRDDPNMYKFCIDKSLIAGFGEGYILVAEGTSGFSRFSVYERVHFEYH